MPAVKIVMGGAHIQLGEGSYENPKDIQALYDMLVSEGIHSIDTAQAYGHSESTPGETNAGSRFSIDTKLPAGFEKGTLSTAKVASGLRESLARLQVEKVSMALET